MTRHGGVIIAQSHKEKSGICSGIDRLTDIQLMWATTARRAVLFIKKNPQENSGLRLHNGRQREEQKYDSGKMMVWGT